MIIGDKIKKIICTQYNKNENYPHKTNQKILSLKNIFLHSLDIINLAGIYSALP